MNTKQLLAALNRTRVIASNEYGAVAEDFARSLAKAVGGDVQQSRGDSFVIDAEDKPYDAKKVGPAMLKIVKSVGGNKETPWGKKGDDVVHYSWSISVDHPHRGEINAYVDVTVGAYVIEIFCTPE